MLSIYGNFTQFFSGANDEEKLEPKDIIVSIKDANDDSTSRSSSETEGKDKNDLTKNSQKRRDNVIFFISIFFSEEDDEDDEEEEFDEKMRKDAIVTEKTSPFLRRSRRGSVIESKIKPELKRSVSDEIEDEGEHSVVK